MCRLIVTQTTRLKALQEGLQALDGKDQGICAPSFCGCQGGGPNGLKGAELAVGGPGPAAMPFVSVTADGLPALGVGSPACHQACGHLLERKGGAVAAGWLVAACCLLTLVLWAGEPGRKRKAVLVLAEDVFPGGC